MLLMRGYEVIRTFFTNLGDSWLFIITLRASTMKEDVDKCYLSGMDAFMSRPVNFLSLKEGLMKKFE